jgi:hypothetical protein
MGVSLLVGLSSFGLAALAAWTALAILRHSRRRAFAAFSTFAQVRRSRLEPEIGNDRHCQYQSQNEAVFHTFSFL